MKEINSITLEIVANSITSIAEQMGVILSNTAPTLKREKIFLLQYLIVTANSCHLHSIFLCISAHFPVQWKC